MGDETSEAVKESVDSGPRSSAPEIVTRSEEGEENEQPPTAAATAASVSGELENTNGNSDPEPNNVLGSNKSPPPVGETKAKGLEDDKSSWVIDVKPSGGGGGVAGGGGGGKLDENFDGERVCRICHLCSDSSSQTPPRTTNAVNLPVTVMPPGLIQLGCDCKDELGVVHARCAEAWFRLKGNRQCEICGECAKNITGVVDNRFIEEWNDSTSATSGTHMGGGGREEGCWRRQPFCNFVMACLVIAFVLPWFFRVNVF